MVVMAAAAATADARHGPGLGGGAGHGQRPEESPALKHALGPADLIMPHITDSRTMEIPWFNKRMGARSAPAERGRCTSATRRSTWGPPSTWCSCCWRRCSACWCWWARRARTCGPRRAVGHPKGFAAGIESVVLYLRDKVFLPSLGPHGDAYIPFVSTLFFFILFMNLMGLMPYGSTPTGNVSVTATLAICAFIATETAGMMALGAMGYFEDGGLLAERPAHWPCKLPLTLVMTPVEIIGKFTKPFALTIRLFANMIAGHVIVLAMIGLVFTFGSWLIAPAPIGMAIGIMILEVLVSFIQAFVFALLTAVFIGQIQGGASLADSRVVRSR